MPYRDKLANADTLPLPGPTSARDRQRIVIVSASVGAGHDGAATELARRLEASGFHVDRHDFLDFLPAHSGGALRAAYHLLLTWTPSVYQRIYAKTEKTGRPGPGIRALFRAAERRILRALPADTSAVISTYPGASQVLGRLRKTGRLGIPALTYLTDFSVHGLWVAAGIDVHLAAHPVPAAQAHAQGAAGVTVSGPLVDPRFHSATEAERHAARTRFGLPEDARLALLVAGSWGVGPVRQAAAEIASTGVAVPVVVCGRNQTLVDQLHADGIEHAFGWVSDMPELMRAADVLVQNAGGLSCLEAFASGLPVASYRCIPGHGQTNAAALDEAELATWIPEPHHLGPVLAQLLDGPRGERQRADALALYQHSTGPIATIAQSVRTAQTAAVATPTTAVRRPARRRLTLVTATLAMTAVLGVGAPLADAATGAPFYLGAYTKFLAGPPR
ncbi:UDP-N-acetylglucosamine:LPS N-acetylglucosamine transferase [Streptacidiphilus sp. MAP12-20]|uniref:glycosyltransferase n=1 Tax=Streptacidiphilus sp. MAP12-20 TaxID=3156299 RepID=UPI0035147CCE